MSLSPASVRNVMSDLENLGLVYSPHASAGRMPTESGLRLFVDGILEVGNINNEERQKIDAQINHDSNKSNVEEALNEVSDVLSGLSSCAGVVLTDKKSNRLKHVEFVNISAEQALVVMVSENGAIENRVIDLPNGMPASALIEATNYLNHHIRNMSLDEAQRHITLALEAQQAELDQLTQKLIKQGIATWSSDNDQTKSLIVRGRSNLFGGSN